MNCTNCNSELRNAAICPNCGTESTEPVQSRRKRNLTAISLALGLMVVAALIFAGTNVRSITAENMDNYLIAQQDFAYPAIRGQDVNVKSWFISNCKSASNFYSLVAGAKTKTQVRFDETSDKEKYFANWHLSQVILQFSDPAAASSMIESLKQIGQDPSCTFEGVERGLISYTYEISVKNPTTLLDGLGVDATGVVVDTNENFKLRYELLSHVGSIVAVTNGSWAELYNFSGKPDQPVAEPELIKVAKVSIGRFLGHEPLNRN